MKDEEINRIIAEFMGNSKDCHGNNWDYALLENVRTDGGYDAWAMYTESLDALVPVWDKLECHEVTAWNKHSSWGISFEVGRMVNGRYDYIDCPAETIQQAAAHSTAKAILKLREIK